MSATGTGNAGRRDAGPSPAGAAPRWGNAFSRALGRGVLRLFGWQLEVTLPDAPKLVIAAAPHTSNWDGVFGIAAILAVGLRIHWFAKDSLFRPGVRGLLVRLGGVPIVREQPGGIVEQTAAIFAARERFWVGLAPEGTRSRAPVWKSGFYRIALAAGTPIQLAYIDHRRKCVGTGPLILPSGDYAADLARMQAFFRTVTPRHPELFAAEG